MGFLGHEISATAAPEDKAYRACIIGVVQHSSLDYATSDDWTYRQISIETPTVLVEIYTAYKLTYMHGPDLLLPGRIHTARGDAGKSLGAAS